MPGELTSVNFTQPPWRPGSAQATLSKKDWLRIDDMVLKAHAYFQTTQFQSWRVSARIQRHGSSLHDVSPRPWDNIANDEDDND